MYCSIFWETAATQNCGHTQGISLTSLPGSCETRCRVPPGTGAADQAVQAHALPGGLRPARSIQPFRRRRRPPRQLKAGGPARCTALAIPRTAPTHWLFRLHIHWSLPSHYWLHTARHMAMHTAPVAHHTQRNGDGRCCLISRPRYVAIM